MGGQIEEMEDALEHMIAERDRLRAVNAELLEALKDAVTLFDLDDECNDVRTPAYRWMRAARAAIAKATGGEP